MGTYANFPGLFLRTLAICLALALLKTGCSPRLAELTGASLDLPAPVATEEPHNPADDCPVAEPVYDTPPVDPAVQNEPQPGFFFINEDKTIWASAWWAKGNSDLLATTDGIKVGWYRPEGAELEITGKRLDGKAPPLDSHIPCCYPTRFQATGLYFPTGGCWEVNAKAAKSQLTFVVYLDD
jgi:hypothetical protein